MNEDVLLESYFQKKKMMKINSELGQINIENEHYDFHSFVNFILMITSFFDYILREKVKKYVFIKRLQLLHRKIFIFL